MKFSFGFAALTVYSILEKVYGQSANSQPDIAVLQELAQYRQHFRKTIDGRLCAAVFVQDFQTYTDCTISRSPDGTSGREWCYVEPQVAAAGGTPWNYCLPIINYDLVRTKANDVFSAKAKEAQNLASQLTSEAMRLSDMIDRYNNTCGAQQGIVSNRLDRIETLIQKGNHCLSKIQDSMTKIDAIKENIDEMERDITRDRDFALSRPENCELLPGYEDIPFPDGLRGAYYNNAIFDGAPRNFRNDRSINMMWLSKDPIEGVANQQFSVRWDGFLLVPETGRYKFSIETDCGARLFLGGKAIIVDRMPQASPGDATGEKTIPLILDINYDGSHKVSSNTQELIGGQKYRIRVEFFHSNHLRWSNPDTAYIKLMWKSGTINEQIIPATYFYTGDPHPPLKITGVNPAFYEIETLFSGAMAHSDSSNHFIADVPMKYEGAKLLKTKMLPEVHESKITVNTPSTLFIATEIGESLPINSKNAKFSGTGDVMSIYTADSPESSATEAKVLRISMVELNNGGSLEYTVSNSKKPYLIFLMQKKANSGCAGDEVSLSKPSSVFFSSCASSSKLDKDHSCDHALNGKNLDSPKGIWKSAKNNAIGEFLTVKFKKPVQLHRFQFKPINDPVGWPAEITLKFPAETGQQPLSFSVLHTADYSKHVYSLETPIITDEVKAEVTRMYVNSDLTGGSFEFFGRDCA